MVAALFTFAAASAQSDVVTNFNSSLDALKANDFATAIPLLEQVIIDGEMEEDETVLNCVKNAKTQLPVAYMKSGLMEAKAQNFDAAIEKLNQAMSKAKMYNNTKVAQAAGKALAQVYQVQGGVPFNEGNYAVAAEIFAKGYEANPRETKLAMLLAESYFKINEYEKGMKVCEEVMALPNTSLFEAGKAEAQAKMSMYTNNKVAELQKNEDFDGVIAMAETIADQALAQRITVQAYLMKKDYAKVIELGDAAAELQTTDEDKSAVYFNLASAYNAKEMKQQAIAAFGKVTAEPYLTPAKEAIAGLSK
jgi:tetratricopeptide (TPR) repeat protein